MIDESKSIALSCFTFHPRKSEIAWIAGWNLLLLFISIFAQFTLGMQSQARPALPNSTQLGSGRVESEQFDLATRKIFISTPLIVYIAVSSLPAYLPAVNINMRFKSNRFQTISQICLIPKFIFCLLLSRKASYSSIHSWLESIGVMCMCVCVMDSEAERCGAVWC